MRRARVAWRLSVARSRRLPSRPTRPSVDTLCAHDGRRDILGSRCAVGRRDGATSAPTSKTRRLCGDDVDDTSNCIAAVQGRGWPCNQFDSFDLAHRDRKRFPCVRLSESASETRRPLSRTRMRLFPTLVSPRIPMTPCASFADTTPTPGVPRELIASDVHIRRCPRQRRHSDPVVVESGLRIRLQAHTRTRIDGPACSRPGRSLWCWCCWATGGRVMKMSSPARRRGMHRWWIGPRPRRRRYPPCRQMRGL